MALTFSVIAEGKWVDGNKDVRIVDVTFDSSYAGSGGEAVTPSDVGLTKIIDIGDGVSTNGYIVTGDTANLKLKVWDHDYSTATDGPLQETATSDLSGETVRLTFIGR